MKDMDEVEVLMVRCMQGHVAKHNFDSQEKELENEEHQPLDPESASTTIVDTQEPQWGAARTPKEDSSHK